MEKFNYEIADVGGLHARPAGLLVQCARGLVSRVTIICHGKQADAKRLFSVMGLGAKQGDTLTVTVEGVSEQRDAAQMQSFLKGL